MQDSSTIDISSDRIISWMNVIRETTGVEQYRLLENFWASQLRSKAWLINTLKTTEFSRIGNVYVFGGWYGILASLIKDNFPYTNVYSVDIDPVCETVGRKLDNRISYITNDMASYNVKNASLIINTSTEHITQETFGGWLQNMPNDTLIVLQGNNYFSCDEHIRCYSTQEEFNIHNKLHEIIYTNKLDCIQFTRFMTIGYKNE
jgi:hypothetical protein